MSDFKLNVAMPCDFEWEVNEKGFPTIFVVPQVDPDLPGEPAVPGFTLDQQTIKEAIEDDLDDPEYGDIEEWLDLADGLSALAATIRQRMTEFYQCCD